MKLRPLLVGLVLALMASAGLSQAEARTEMSETAAWQQLRDQLGRELPAALDRPDRPLPSTEDEVLVMLEGLLKDLHDPWDQPLEVDAVVEAQSVRRLVHGAFAGPPLGVVEQRELLVEVSSNGPDLLRGTGDEVVLADLRLPLPRLGEVDPALVGPKHGAIVGVVTDEISGEILPGVTVTVAGPWMIGERVALSDLNGSFAAGHIPAGSYQVVFQLEGHLSVIKSVVVRAEQPSRVEVVLPSSLRGCG